LLEENLVAESFVCPIQSRLAAKSVQKYAIRPAFRLAMFHDAGSSVLVVYFATDLKHEAILFVKNNFLF